MSMQRFRTFAVRLIGDFRLPDLSEGAESQSSARVANDLNY